MSGPDPDTFLADPLSAIARLERRNLLITSTLSILLVHANLIPKKLSALGLEFDAPEQRSFLIILALTILYMMAAFAICAAADWFRWRNIFQTYIEALDDANRSRTQDQQDLIDAREIPQIDWYYQHSPLVARFRIALEFGAPLAIGLYALSALIWRAFYGSCPT